MTYDWYLDGKKRETLESYRYLEEIDCFQYYFCAKNPCGVVLKVPYSCWSSDIKAKKKEEPSSSHGHVDKCAASFESKSDGHNIRVSIWLKKHFSW